MKVRTSFVSNSSSSSFVISKEFLSPRQIERIKDHINTDLGYTGSDDAWEIEESQTQMSGCVDMDNFDMEEFLNLIGVDMEEVKWGN